MVTRFQAGDSDQFALLYLRYFDRVYAYVRAVLRSAADAEDVTQQIFVDVLTGLPRYERRRQPFRAWLFTVARNHAIDHLQHHGRLDLVDADEVDRRREHAATDEGELDLLSWISDRDLHLFIERLPLTQRQVLLLRFVMGLTASEIAGVLEISPEAVRMQQSRALGFLRARLTAMGRDPCRGNRVRARLLIPQSRVLRVRRFGLTFGGPTG
jgi:RNA polymerase sigma-70 factor (ECF subfamily)